MRTASESHFAYASDEDFYSYAKMCGNPNPDTIELLLEDVPIEEDAICKGDRGCREIVAEAVTDEPPSSAKTLGDPHCK